MNRVKIVVVSVLIAGTMVSCVGKKKYAEVQSRLSMSDQNLQKCNDDLLAARQNIVKLQGDLTASRSEGSSAQRLREEQIGDLRRQIADLQKNRDQQLVQLEGLTVLSKTANENIDKTLAQMSEKDKYIKLLLAAKNRVDSLNLALAVNLKQSIGLDLNDKDVDIKVDKTVVFINLSDAMMYKSGSYKLTPRAEEVLGKIAKIIISRPELEVMVEGYTDDTPIKTDILDDNWDLSVKRSTAVVRVLQNKYKVNPDRLIASGRGEYNQLVPNTSADNKAKNRRTRIILMPKLDQFYELLDPATVAKK
ncbi:OmpA/MotB family protein [Jiulongibacter sediminis]|uniref:Membrane protein n=1 Tax=Jiulongibacter sediminis TaxID=1605367 RepID=A0A0P7BZ39_9BACT|nr:OmpA family protein [Jiulongibacter sediminis]KPM47427.1 membrane protein [Jiulongibacter sediminis]TBX23006.1 membrane protein [Jiulongibacter sediminis]